MQGSHSNLKTYRGRFYVYNNKDLSIVSIICPFYLMLFFLPIKALRSLSIHNVSQNSPHSCSLTTLKSLTFTFIGMQAIQTIFYIELKMGCTITFDLKNGRFQRENACFTQQVLFMKRKLNLFCEHESCCIINKKMKIMTLFIFINDCLGFIYIIENKMSINKQNTTEQQSCENSLPISDDAITHSVYFYEIFNNRL